MSAEQVLILGGTKFIGPHLVRALREAGYEPTVFHRGTTPWPWDDAPPALLGDREQAADLRAAARAADWEAVCDLTAFKPTDSALAAEAFQDRCGIFLHVSTGSVYQVIEAYHNPYSENDAQLFASALPLVRETEPDHPAVQYGLNKRACEETLLRAFEERGFPVTIIRPPIVSGPLDYTLRDYSHLLRLRDGGPLIVPVNAGAFQHVAVQDLADLMVKMLELWDMSIGEAFNAGGASLFSLSEYYSTFARLLGLPEPVIHAVPFDTIEREIGEGSQPFGYPRNAVPDIAKARWLLDWEPRRAECYLPEIAAYFEGEYRGPEPESYTKYRAAELRLAGALAPRDQPAVAAA